MLIIFQETAIGKSVNLLRKHSSNDVKGHCKRTHVGITVTSKRTPPRLSGIHSNTGTHIAQVKSSNCSIFCRL